MGCHLVDVARVVHAARVGVRVPGGTYSRSLSLSKPMTIWTDGASDLECPREDTRSCFGAISTYKQK